MSDKKNNLEGFEELEKETEIDNTEETSELAEDFDEIQDENEEQDEEYDDEEYEDDDEYDDEEYDDYEYDGVQDELAGAVVATKTKKKSILMPCTLVSLAIVLIAILSGAVYLIFFNVDLTGSYVIVDETNTSTIDTYLILEDNGVAKLKSESLTYGGTYSITADNLFSVNVNMGQSTFAGDFNYTVEGNKLTGQSLILTSEYATAPLEFKSVSEVPNPIKPVEGFKPDERLLGLWTNYDEAYGATTQYMFNDDGTMYAYLESAGYSVKIDFTYEVKEDTIDKVYIVNGEEQVMPSTYAFDGDTLVMDGLGFTKAE